MYGYKRRISLKAIYQLFWKQLQNISSQPLGFVGKEQHKQLFNPESNIPWQKTRRVCMTDRKLGLARCGKH